MDPAQGNNNDPQNPNTPAPPNPIEPGQFVTTGDPESVFKQPPAPGTPATFTPPEPQIPAPPIPQTPMQSALPPEPSPLPQQAPGAALPFENQPSPAPYVPPQATGQNPPQPPSTIGKMRTFLIAGGFLVLIALVAVAVWFLILKKAPAPTSVTNTVPDVTVPSTPPTRTTGGFSEIPATPSAESTPAAPPVAPPVQ